MTPSRKAEAFIKGYEQCRLTAYMPTPNDVPTIGWGSTGPDIHLGMTWNQAEADQRFSRDIAEFAAGVARRVDPNRTTQHQFDAMVSLAYNIGAAAFKNSTVLRRHNEGDFVAAANAFALWNKQAGRVLNGLTKRRAAEAAMYRS